MRKTLITYFLPIVISLACLFLPSCYTYRSTGLLQEDNSFLPVYDSIGYVDYKIRVNDKIVYRLISIDETFAKVISTEFGTGSQIMSYTVYADGTVDLPYVRNIKVEGLTIEEAEKEVERRMREIIPDASVKLTLENKTFTMIGDIGKGVFPIYKDRMTIYQALALSGLVQQSGDRKHIKILRETDDGIKELEFDIRPKSVINSEYYYVYPNDIIYVQRDPLSFFKVSTYSALIGIVSTSINLLLLSISF